MSEVDVPEPPPFFWAQFSARVKDAVANEAEKPRLAAFSWARASWMGVAAAASTIPNNAAAPAEQNAFLNIMAPHTTIELGSPDDAGVYPGQRTLS